MKRTALALFFVAAALASCDKPRTPKAVPQLSTAAPPTHKAIMDEIERTVRLPAGAYPLERYGRNYAFSGDGRVVAVYFSPSDDWGRTMYAVAGERRWHDWERELPFIMDGGCSIVHVTYEIATRHILSVSCNGVA